MRILVADDSRTLRFALKMILEALGHEVVEAGTGSEALARLTEPDAPAMAILDWLMPDMDGPDVCQALRRMPLALQPYLILLTSKDAKEDMIQGLGMGANDYINKPYHEGELRARLSVGERVVNLEMALAERVRALEGALAEIRTLQGILPICMYCHKIRDDGSTWQRLDQYITEHADVQLSHGVCPDCRDRFIREVGLPQR